MIYDMRTGKKLKQLLGEPVGCGKIQWLTKVKGTGAEVDVEPGIYIDYLGIMDKKKAHLPEKMSQKQL